MTCSLCGKPITRENQKQAWRQVVGWVRPGRTKLVDRRETGAYAHAECATRLQQGVHIEQEALFT